MAQWEKVSSVAHHEKIYTAVNQETTSLKPIWRIPASPQCLGSVHLEAPKGSGVSVCILVVCRVTVVVVVRIVPSAAEVWDSLCVEMSELCSSVHSGWVLETPELWKQKEPGTSCSPPTSPLRWAWGEPSGVICRKPVECGFRVNLGTLNHGEDSFPSNPASVLLLSASVQVTTLELSKVKLEVDSELLLSGM